MTASTTTGPPSVLIDASNVRGLFHEGKLNAQDDRGYTCLHWLVLTGNDRLLRNLLRQGADPTLRDAKSLTALDRACRLGRLHMFAALVEACPASLHAARHVDGRTPLHFANDSLQAHATVPLLLNLGADIEARSRLGRTVLHESVLRGGGGTTSSRHRLTVQLVTRHGADVEARDVHGWTPLHYAAYLGHVETAAQLVRLGANVHAREYVRGRTPLHLTASRVSLPPPTATTGDLDVTAMLECNDNTCTTAAAQQQAQDETTTTQWERRFVRPKPVEIAKDLVAHGAVVWTLDDEGNLPFFLAARLHQVDVCFELLQVAAMEGLFG